MRVLFISELNAFTNDEIMLKINIFGVKNCLFLSLAYELIDVSVYSYLRSFNVVVAEGQK